jgi:predicted SAM-dependent methyltransferase
MRLNLGCGDKSRSGFTNVDFRRLPNVDEVVDLSKLPWPWKNDSADEIIMLDFLEHFPYKQTEPILQECWRILRKGGMLRVQVPDLFHCALAAAAENMYMCNRCGTEMLSRLEKCPKCEQSTLDIAMAATHRLYGGQDYDGNWHYHAFTEFSLSGLLKRNGFTAIVAPRLNENGETYFQNWNIRLDAVKGELDW